MLVVLTGCRATNIFSTSTLIIPTRWCSIDEAVIRKYGFRIEHETSSSDYKMAMQDWMKAIEKATNWMGLPNSVLVV